MAKWLRDSCLFSRHDVTRDPPFAKVDLISCRNLLIYFDNELQRQALPVFHYALNADGLLLLGKSESVGGFSNLFSLTDKSNKLFFKKNTSIPLRMSFPVGRYAVERLNVQNKLPEPYLKSMDVQRESERIALLEYAPPSVVINNGFEIVQARGRTAPFLELSPGHPSLNLLRMAHPELIADLRAAVQAARKKNAPILKKGLQIRDDGKLRTLSVKVVPIPAPSQMKERYFTIFFEELRGQNTRQSREPAPARAENEVELQKKLSANQEYQQSLIEEYETSQEELVSANEELQSTNEELQSTNEELETAKEELQSANEELTTVNDEMQTRNTEMIHLNNDLTNLLASVDIPIVMVGPDGKIRRFTP
ncbi:MAG: hypothetical protein HY074_11135, partial [Deltaproteobacteria bacterium]|nr:hypothetical protein [Deltaproteobacteria bacterium]